MYSGSFLLGLVWMPVLLTTGVDDLACAFIYSYGQKSQVLSLVIHRDQEGGGEGDEVH